MSKQQAASRAEIKHAWKARQKWKALSSHPLIKENRPRGEKEAWINLNFSYGIPRTSRDSILSLFSIEAEICFQFNAHLGLKENTGVAFRDRKNVSQDVAVIPY